MIVGDVCSDLGRSTEEAIKAASISIRVNGDFMFIGAKSKVRWANRLIQQLSTVVEGFIQSDFYRLETKFDRHTGRYSIEFDSKKRCRLEMCWKRPANLRAG
jgi:tRNA(His) 5'-end guanylyltransferase